MSRTGQPNKIGASKGGCGRELDRVDKIKSLMQQKNNKRQNNPSSPHHNYRPHSLLKQYQSTVPVKQEEEKDSLALPNSLHKPHNNSISTGSALKKILEESSVIFKSAASSQSFDLGLEAHRPETIESSRSVTPMRLSLNEELRSPEVSSSRDSNFSNFKGHNINKRVEQPRPATATHHYLLSRQKDHKNGKNGGTRKDYVRKKLNDTFKDIAVDSSILNEGRSSYSGKITRRFLKDEKEKQADMSLLEPPEQASSQPCLEFESFIVSFLRSSKTQQAVQKRTEGLQKQNKVNDLGLAKFIANAEAVKNLLNDMSAQ